MKRRQFLSTAGLAAGGAALARPAIAQTTPDVRWKLASSFPTTFEAFWSGAQAFAESVKQQSDGRFTIDIHPAGALVGALDVFEAAQDGRIDCAHTALHYFWGKEPALAFGTGVPFGMNAREQNAFFRQGGGTGLINDVLADHKLVALPMGNTGCQMGGWFRKEINTPGDLRGLKFRISGFAAKILQTLGVEPRAVGRREISSSLASGALDAVAWVSPVDDEKLDLVKSAPHYYYPGVFQPNMSLHLLVNAGKWNDLPKAYQAILRAATDTANADVQAKYDAANPPALRRLAENGARLHAFAPDLLEAFWQATEKAYRETAAGDAKFQRLHSAYMDFRNDQYLWWQVAEYPYDNFLIRQRAKG